MNKSLGPEQFRDWLRRRGFSQADAARYLQMEEPYLSTLLSGRRSPGLSNAVHIERLTGIPIEAWAKDLDETATRQPLTSRKPLLTKA